MSTITLEEAEEFIKTWGIDPIRYTKEYFETDEYGDNSENLIEYHKERLNIVAEAIVKANSARAIGYTEPASQGDLLADTEYKWQTESAHSDNTETMQDYLDNHLPGGYEIIEQGGSLAIVGKMNKIIIHASGDGDFTHHKVRFEKFS